MSRLALLTTLVPAALVWTALVAAAADPPAPTTRPATAATGPAAVVRVMSFNIRYGTARDGDDHWDRRKAFLVDTIRAYDPDLLGTQEVLAGQADFLRQQLPGYGFVGTGRDDGARGGEFSPVMFRTDRFDLLASGQIWLSETPAKVGSKGWDAALPRVATWAKLRDHRSGAALLFLNTHWDHVGRTARVESGKVMRRLVDEQRAGTLPVVVTGDFNSTEDSEQYRTLTAGAGGGGAGVRLADAFREVYPKPGPDEASFHAFKGTRAGQRIDWILHSPELTATAAAIDRTQKDGRYPSDHYPVTADLVFRGEPGVRQ